MGSFSLELVATVTNHQGTTVEATRRYPVICWSGYEKENFCLLQVGNEIAMSKRHLCSHTHCIITYNSSATASTNEQAKTMGYITCTIHP